MSLPSITIVTPSYNQGLFIKRTIDSVLNQNYPKLEYIIIDGGSTDNTVEILKGYGDAIWWVSEKDRGQTHAINKGLGRATGKILAYLNSDDIYYPGTLLSVGTFFQNNAQANWLTGGYEIIDASDLPVKRQSVVKRYKEFMLLFYNYFLLKVTNSLIPQPSTFWTRKAFETVGLFDEELRYCMDYDYWLRMGKRFPLYQVREQLSGFRIHENSKSTRGYREQFAEELAVLEKNGGSGLEKVLHRMHTELALLLYRQLK